VSEQRGVEQASKKSDAPEKTSGTENKTGASEAVGPSSEDISRLLVQVQEFLGNLLPRRESSEEDELTVDDLESYAKVRAFLSRRREGGLGSLIGNLEDALAVIADARDDIDTYLEEADLEQDRRRPARRLTARR
jgi:hypothetical protein